MHSLTIVLFCLTLMIIRMSSSSTLKRNVQHEDQIQSKFELCQKKTNDPILQGFCQNYFIKSSKGNINEEDDDEFSPWLKKRFLNKKKRREDSSSSSSIDDDDDDDDQKKKMKKKRRSFVRRGLEKKFILRSIGKRII